MKTFLFRATKLIFGFFLILSTTLHAQTDLNYTNLNSFPNAVLEKSQSKNIENSSYNFRMQKGNATEFAEIKGNYWGLKYLIKTSDGKIDNSVTRNKILDFYKNLISAKKGKIRYEKSNKITFTIPNKGKELWCYLVASTGSYSIHIIEGMSFKTKTPYEAADLKKALDDAGHISVYGINFATGKATLNEGADEILLEMVKLLKNNPNLKLEIQGHTDNIGAEDQNLLLSIQRAETVKEFLQTQGIEPSRLSANGFGSSKPVDSNDTEEGRAKNRRVELVRVK